MQSMTGYGRSHLVRDGRDLLMELKTVNHRSLDVTFRLPKPLTFLEEPLRARLSDGRLKRGHIDVFVTYLNHRDDANAIRLDRPLLRQCERSVAEAADELNLPTPTLSELIQMSGALSITQGDEDVQAVTALAMDAFEQALAELVTMRSREGDALAADLSGNLKAAEAVVKRIALRAPQVPLLYRERLETRLREWAVDAVDSQRMAQEVALMADRCAIDEELSRLNSHFAQFEAGLRGADEIGRRLDFLLQEMNRETNTIGSKACDAEIAQAVVDVKCLLEKLREQVQNAV